MLTQFSRLCPLSNTVAARSRIRTTMKSLLIHFIKAGPAHLEKILKNMNCPHIILYMTLKTCWPHFYQTCYVLTVVQKGGGLAPIGTNNKGVKQCQMCANVTNLLQNYSH